MIRNKFSGNCCQCGCYLEEKQGCALRPDDAPCEQRCARCLPLIRTIYGAFFRLADGSLEQVRDQPILTDEEHASLPHHPHTIVTDLDRIQDATLGRKPTSWRGW